MTAICLANTRTVEKAGTMSPCTHAGDLDVLLRDMKAYVLDRGDANEEEDDMQVRLYRRKFQDLMKNTRQRSELAV